MLLPQQRTRYGSEIQMPLVSIDSIPEVDLADINPFFYQYRPKDEDEIDEEARNEKIKHLLSKNPNLWTTLYTHDIIDSSMISHENIDVETDVPF